MLQKRPELDGVPLPQWRGRLDAAVLVRDYPQQKLGVQQTILRLLGNWPHHAYWKGDNILSSLKIASVDRPALESDWSVVTFYSQENARSGLGARCDLVIGDEPPVEPIWREFRKSAHAGRPNKRIMAVTPLVRRDWAWLKAEFGDPPRRSFTRDGNRAEARWSIFDNSALTRSEIAELLALYETDPLREARIHGDYIDSSGACPFHVPTLLEMLGECRDPDLVPWRVARETEDGMAGVSRVQLEVWAKPDQRDRYYIPIDGSSGIADNKHDPAGLHVRKMGTGELCARWVGNMAPHSLGIFAAGIARQYNNATVDPEINDGWGGGIIDGLREARYHNIAHERRQLRPGEWATEYGFRTTGKSRPLIVSAVQAWIDAWRSGNRYALCPSKAVLDCLLECIMDETGKILAAPGYHDEDLILAGQGIRRSVSTSGREAGMPPPETPASQDERIARMIRGEIEPEELDYKRDRAQFPVPPRYKPRPFA